jgi:hypothetical protein
MYKKLIFLFSLILLLAGELHASDQPVNIFYDDGNPLSMDINQDALFAVRFTPAQPFNLMCVHLMFRNDYNTTDGANVWIAENNGGIPAWPAIFVGQVPPPLTNETWIQFDLAGPMYFENDFFVIVQQRGGPSPGPGFWIGIDYGTTTGRTVKSYSDGQGWLDEPLGDALIRAGGTYATTSLELTPASGAVIVEQIDFRGGPNSGVGEMTIIRSAANATSGLTSGYVNATNSAGQWVVRNLPVLPESICDMPSITTRFDLSVANGTNVSSIRLYVEYLPEPHVTFAGGVTRTFNVGKTIFAAGGVGDDLLNHYLPGPDLSEVTFEIGGIISHTHQLGHRNEQTARNQCAPMAMANSLDWLRTKKGLQVPEKHKHKPGLRSDAPSGGDDPNNPSLVGELEKAMNRDVVNCPPDPNRVPHPTPRQKGCGVWPMDGKLKYISQNCLKDKLLVKHQGNEWTGGANSKKIDGTKNVTRHGFTSYGKGAKVTWDWLCQEIKKGEDVEIDIHFSGPGDGRHYVNVIGCGKILGKPYITHISDHAQTDEDPNDALGTDKLDFAWMLNNRLDHPFLANWNGEVDQAISESVCECPGCITGIPEGDINKDCIVDFADIAIIGDNWLAECTTIVECFPSSHPDYANWVAAGRPDCWCCPAQCHGDSNCDGFVGDFELVSITPLVGTEYPDPQYSPCFDYDHDLSITPNDLNTAEQWYMTEPPTCW